MFNVEQAIANWRQQLADRGLRSSEILDELENHLREEIRRRIAAGTPETEAFRIAVSRLGTLEIVTAEFEKVRNRQPVSLRTSMLLGFGMLLALTTVLVAAGWPGKPSLLLLAHTVTLTVGDVAAFFAGGLGVCYVFGLRLNRLSSGEQRSLSRAAVLSNQLAACLVLTGLFLGMVWSAQSRGQYLAAGPREIGTVCAALWLVVFFLVRRFGRVGIHTTMLLCVAGNLVMCLAWFGTGLVSHGYVIGSSWQLNAALIINLLFLAWGMIPRLASSKT
jgi:hypothetical protein